MENAPMKNWELTLYEMQRKPQEPITDGTKIAVSPRSLQSELLCPICLDILKVTMTTKECLHRFCSDCIVTALRNGNKECPTCRKKLVSKRSLRRDPNFDALIAKIYPDREEYEAHQNRVLAKLNKQQLSGKYNGVHTSQTGIDTESLRSRNRRYVGGNVFTTTESVASEDDAVSTTGSLNNHRPSYANSDAESGTMETTSLGATSSVDFGHRRTGNPLATSTATASFAAATTAVVPEVELMLQPLPPQDEEKCRRNGTGGNSANEESKEKGNGLQMKPEDGSCHPSPKAAASEAGTVGDGGGASGSCSEDAFLGMDTKYIKVPSNATVDHLGRFLSIRFSLLRVNRDITENDPVFGLYYFNEVGNEYVALPAGTTIDEISRIHWSGLNSLTLFYLRENSLQPFSSSQ